MHTCVHEPAVLTCCQTNISSPPYEPEQRQPQPRSPLYAHNELRVCEVCYPKSSVDSILNKCKPRLRKHLQTKAMLTLDCTVYNYNTVLNSTEVATSP